MMSVLFPQLEEELSGIVEVVGTVSNKGAIMAVTYNLLREDRGVPFGRFCFLTQSGDPGRPRRF